MVGPSLTITTPIRASGTESTIIANPKVQMPVPEIPCRTREMTSAVYDSVNMNSRIPPAMARSAMISGICLPRIRPPM